MTQTSDVAAQMAVLAKQMTELLADNQRVKQQLHDVIAQREEEDARRSAEHEAITRRRSEEAAQLESERERQAARIRDLEWKLETTTKPRPMTSEGARGSHSVKSPELFKPGMLVETWLLRMATYVEAIGLVTRREIATTYVVHLSQEAHTQLALLLVDPDAWKDPDAIVKGMETKFGDTKTINTYTTEFRAAVQGADESVGGYFDRVRGLVRKAMPDIASKPKDELRHLRSQFIYGLRDEHIKRAVQFADIGTLEQLRLLAVEREEGEACMRTRTGKAPQAAAHLSSALATGEESLINVESSQCGSVRAKSLAQPNRFKSEQSEDKTRCQLCERLGHTANFCDKLKDVLWNKPKPKQRGQFVQRPMEPSQSTQRQCFRCGRFGHIAIHCTQTQRQNGEPIRSSPNCPVHGSQAARSAITSAASLHCICTRRDGSALTANESTPGLAQNLSTKTFASSHLKVEGGVSPNQLARPHTKMTW